MSGYGVGIDAFLAGGIESTFNTAVSLTKSSPLLSESLELKQTFVDSPALFGGLYESLLDSLNRQSTREAGGQVMVEAYTVGQGWLWDLLMGSSSSANSGAVYTWTHALAPSKGKSGTLQIAKPSTDGVQNPFTYTGCKAADWTLSVEVGKNLQIAATIDAVDEHSHANTPVISGVTQTGAAGSTQYYYRVSAIVGGNEGDAGPEFGNALANATLNGSNYNVVAWSAVPNATGYNVYRSTTSGAELKIASNVATTTYNDQSNAAGTGSPINPLLATPSYTSGIAPFSFADMGLFTLAGSQVAGINKLTITNKNPLANARYYVGGGGAKAEQVNNGMREVSGVLEAEFTSIGALHSAYRSNASLVLQAKATSPLIASGSTNFSLQIDCPAIRLRGKTPPVTGPQMLKVAVPFTGYRTASTKAIQITRVTTDTTI